MSEELHSIYITGSKPALKKFIRAAADALNEDPDMNQALWYAAVQSSDAPYTDECGNEYHIDLRNDADAAGAITLDEIHATKLQLPEGIRDSEHYIRCVRGKEEWPSRTPDATEGDAA